MSENNKTTPVQKLVIGAESVISTPEVKPEVKTTVTEVIQEVETKVEAGSDQSKDPKQDIPMVTQAINPLITDVQTLKMIKSLSFWAKLVAIFQFIGAGFMIIGSFIYIFGIITIPLTFFYWILAGFMIWAFVKVWQASNKFMNLALVETQESFNSNTLQGLNSLKTFFKIQGIMIIVEICMAIAIIIGLLLFAFIFAGNPDFQKSLKNPYSLSSASSINKSNIDESLGTDAGF